MKSKNKFFSLISCCILITGTISTTYSTNIFKIIQDTANTCFRAVKYTGITLAVVTGAWAAKSFKDQGVAGSVIPTILTLAFSGVGYVGWKGEKWTASTENDQKQVSDNEVLHSDSRMQSK